MIEYRKQQTADRRLPSKSFRDLIVWQKAHQFVLDVYQITQNLPKEELYGLTGQLRRAAISIPGNISEGYKKYGLRDKIRFFNVSEGSLEECRYYLLLSKDLFHLETDLLDQRAEEISKLLGAYIKTIKKSVP
ncbi:MAG: four helix bundle protein [Bacteroidota bacterium]